MQINISEELYEKIISDLYYAQGARMNDDSVHMRDVHTDTLNLFEQAYEDGLDESVLEAYKRYGKGEKPTWSTGICESLTAGYGKCDDYGYFEFPLVISETTSEILSWEEYTAYGEEK